MASSPETGDDAGFSLIEVVVAMTLFAILTVAVLAVLVTSLGGVRSNAQRVQAANLAAQQIEAVRSQRADEIPDGVTAPASSGTTLDGTTYAVRQTAAYYAGDRKQNICDSTSDTPSFKRISVSVTWPDMGSVEPVRSDTVVAVGLGKAALNKGIAAVMVVDAAAAPVKNVLVSLDSGATSTTDEQGCAVFTNVAPGSYLSVVDAAGYVGIDGQQRYVSPSALTVTASKISRELLQYDRPGRLAVTWKSVPTGFRLPDAPAMAVSLGYALAVPAGPRPAALCTGSPVPGHCVTGPPQGPLALSPLFPANYQVWAGVCADSRPDDVAAVDLAPGAPGSVAVALASLELVSSSAGSSPFTGWTVSATHAADARCAKTTLTFGTVPSTGNLGISLPQGTWTVQVTDPRGTGSQGQTFTLTAGRTSVVRA